MPTKAPTRNKRRARAGMSAKRWLWQKKLDMLVERQINAAEIQADALRRIAAAQEKNAATRDRIAAARERNADAQEQLQGVAKDFLTRALTTLTVPNPIEFPPVPLPFQETLEKMGRIVTKARRRGITEGDLARRFSLYCSPVEVSTALRLLPSLGHVTKIGNVFKDKSYVRDGR
jgi:hypothetical protein